KSVNNVINYNQDGIKVSNVSDIVILSNTIFSNMRFGIVFINSNDCLISSNYVYDNLFNGVHLRDTQTTTINRNTIFNHWHNDLSQSGILLDNSSNTHVANNSIFNNHYGINFLNSADNNMITNNTVLDNQEYGLRLEYASDNTIIYNNISDNGLYGILITSGADGNLIQFNAFVGNYGGETQATDDGVSNKFSGNYWDDWSNPDLDEDLIVDNPYPIDGTANNSDPYPLVEFSMEAIENVKTNPNFVGILLFMLTVLTLFGGSTGAGYFVYRTRLKPRDVDSEFEPEEPFSEFVSEELIERVKPLYHKLVVGLENIQTSALPQPITVPLLEPAEPITLIEYFPSDIKEDLRSRIKWRTVLTLIEIAYQDPSETNVINLAKSMDIPTSTLSKEIKRLINLHYIEFFVTAKVLQDARYRTYVITPKGFKLLYILKEAFKLAITRIKEKRGDFYI
ncbi:MAG: NosD domain-containing protein, partial [Candidatus Hodarchaeota archaeon]